MENSLIRGFRGRAFAPFVRTATVALLALPLGACDLDDLLTVPDPEVATPEVLEGETALPILLAGAQADFQVAFSGSGTSEGQVSMSAIMTDELHYTSTFPTRIEVDRRAIEVTNTTMEPIHRLLQRARASAGRAVDSYAEFGANTAGQAESLNLLGFTYILFAEHYCSGVPFSQLTSSGATEYGDPQTTVQMLEAAVQSFTAARTAADAAGSPEQASLARVGLGRALLNLGRFSEAAAAVAGVPDAFVYLIEHSENSDRQNNGMYTYQWLGRRWSVADRQGTNGLAYRSDADPRVPWARGTAGLTNGFDNSPLYLSYKYDSRSAPTVLASGAEARLIEAEAALQGVNTGLFLTRLNNLRAAPPAYYPEADFPGIGTLAPLTLPATQGDRVSLLFKERAYWMYATAHRLGDMRRLIRQYGRTENQVFPVGAYGTWTPDKSGEYGDDVNFPIPFDEQNNPKFQQCLDRNA